MELNKINVVYITDENYIMPTCVSACSLIYNKGSVEQVDIHFIVNNISSQSKEKLMALASGDVRIHIIEVRDELYAEMAKSCLAYKSIHVSYTSMFKFDLPQLLKEVDKVLYIDGDTLIQTSLLDLYNTSLDGYYIAAVDDAVQKLKTASPINTKENYFNSGVMLLNLKKMREDNITEKLIDYRMYGVNFFMDQDSFNIVLGAQRVMLPYTYNFLTTMLDNFDVDEIMDMMELEKADSITEIIENVSILHLTDRTKPWIYYMPWFTERFMNYYNHSPFATEKLNLLNPIKEQKQEMLMLRNRIDELHNRLKLGNNSYLQPYEEKIAGKNIIVYGAGRRGRNMKSRLDTLCNVIAWVDKNYKTIASEEEGPLTKVQSPEILKTTTFECVLVTIVDQRVLTDVKRYLVRELGIEREKIITLYEKRSDDRIATEIADLYPKWKGKEHDLALQYIEQINNIPGGAKVKHIGMMYRWLTIGGLQRVVAMLSALFCEMHYQVTLILDTKEEMAYELPDDIEIITIPGENEVQNTGSYLQRAKRLRGVIREKKIDTIIYHGVSSPILLYDLLLCKKSNVYFVGVKHEMFSQYMAYRSDTLYMQQNVFKLADRLVVLGRDECNFWEVQGVRAIYISNPTGEYAISSQKARSDGYILWLGRLVRMQKQCMDVIPIMREVVKVLPNAIMKIYGNEAAPGIVNELKGQIEKFHLEKNIEYCGYVTGNVGEIYQNAAVFLVTSEYESFSLTIYESKLNGTPLVTYQMPYLELLKDGLGYISVENDNTVQAANAIVKLLQDEELRKRLSKEAKESVLRFDNLQVKECWRQLFETLGQKKEVAEKNYSAEELRVLLETMMYHYHKGIKVMSQRDMPQTQGLAAVLDYYYKWKMLPPVIYPFGTVGKRVRNILNEQLHIKEAFVVDNKLSKSNPDIKCVEDLKKMDCSKYLFFVCCKLTKYHDEILKSLQGIVPENNIVDLYPRQ